MKKVLTIAGSDCSGGSGIEADLKTFCAYGVYGMCVITSLVAENTVRVIGKEDCSEKIIGAQLDAVFGDIPPDAVKIGMLPSAACMKAVSAGIRKYSPRNIVADPVMIASSGGRLMDKDAMGAFIKYILPLSDMLTPNIPEAAALSGISVSSRSDMEKAAEIISGLGAKSVLVKGGHLKGKAEDIFYDGTGFYRFESDRINTRDTHGTGCTYSSAIAAGLALGYGKPKAVESAKAYVTGAIKHSLRMGNGSGPLNHFYNFRSCFYK